MISPGQKANPVNLKQSRLADMIVRLLTSHSNAPQTVDKITNRDESPTNETGIQHVPKKVSTKTFNSDLFMTLTHSF